MCGIPIEPPPDYTQGRRLTFEQAVAHVGGMDNLISAEGRNMIDLHRRDYMWKYPGHAWCTYCGGDAGDVHAKHNADVTCPRCGRTVRFKHEARGHSRIFEQFCLYEWRRSVIDPEAVVLTAAHVWRNSTGDNPEREPLNVHASALYVFRPEHAVTVYKNHTWNRDEAKYWNRVDSVAPDHTMYQGGSMDIVIDYGQFVSAIEGTRIGRLFRLLTEKSNRRDTLELDAVASCARRPWLEYMAKAGQTELAARLMRMRTIPKDVIRNQRARSPRELLNLTEAQWHETRRDGIRLTVDMLKCLEAFRRMGFGGIHMSELQQLMRDSSAVWHLDTLAPSKARRPYDPESLSDILASGHLPEKLRRKILRRALRDLPHAMEWRDYFAQLRRLGEDMCDTALCLPRDMHAMHLRMIERENALRAEAMAKVQAAKDTAEAAKNRVFASKRLPKLRKEYLFHAHGLVLRPYESVSEVHAEGRELHICIGSYADRYLSGGTVICCLRREEEPDTPWRAVEFSAQSGKKVQDRGMHNDTRGGIEPGTRKQLRLFWAAFDRAHRRAKTA